MNYEQQNEVMRILQEECAEVIQAVSKVFRFGYETRFPTDIDPSNQEKLEEEIGDLQAMIDILVENSILSDTNINAARHNKKFKLMRWTKIYEETA